MERQEEDRHLQTLLRSVVPPIDRLDEYFEGRRRTFDVPLDWTLTRAFRHEVLHATTLIPYGETSSYRKVATAAGRPKAVRAAGSALANNPLPILVPCHRVLRTDGTIGQLPRRHRRQDPAPDPRAGDLK
jgi:O-6-methylguanine DNA methyltransferase